MGVVVADRRPGLPQDRRAPDQRKPREDGQERRNRREAQRPQPPVARGHPPRPLFDTFAHARREVARHRDRRQIGEHPLDRRLLVDSPPASGARRRMRLEQRARRRVE
jgi:hypothetical protein